MQTWFSRKKYVYPKIMSYHFCCRVAYARVVCLNNQERKKKSVASSPSSSSSPWRFVASTPLYLSCCASRKWTHFYTFRLRHKAVRSASLRYIITVNLNTSVPVNNIHQLALLFSSDLLQVAKKEQKRKSGRCNIISVPNDVLIMSNSEIVFSI